MHATAHNTANNNNMCNNIKIIITYLSVTCDLDEAVHLLLTMARFSANSYSIGGCMYMYT